MPSLSLLNDIRWECSWEYDVSNGTGSSFSIPFSLSTFYLHGGTEMNLVKECHVLGVHNKRNYEPIFVASSLFVRFAVATWCSKFLSATVRVS